MAPTGSRRSGYSRRAQYNLFTGYVIAGIGALIGAILFGLTLPDGALLMSSDTGLPQHAQSALGCRGENDARHRSVTLVMAAMLSVTAATPTDGTNGRPAAGVHPG